MCQNELQHQLANSTEGSEFPLSTASIYKGDSRATLVALALAEWDRATQGLEMILSPSEIDGPCGCTGVTCPLSGLGTS